MKEQDLRDKRREYIADGLNAADLKKKPVDQFSLWFDQASQVVVEDVTAMTLATANGAGQPSARIVLLKHFDSKRGFAWYTDYRSDKGKDLWVNPKASLLFYWQALNRQVRIEGTVSRLTAEDSAQYFHERPRGSQISAYVSEQSAVIDHRATLEARAAQCDQENPEQIPWPDVWGGYVLKPTQFEFWQGRENRLHDRFQYRQKGKSWEIVRLQP